MRAHLLGLGRLTKSGTHCACDSEYASGSCARTPVDCDPGGPFSSCPQRRLICQQNLVGGQCFTGDECSSGFCDVDGGTGSCCSDRGQQCASDKDCCPGLQCATDTTGCRVGPTPSCLIDGHTFPSMTLNPDNECQYCDPYHSPNAWANVGSYQRCDGGTPDAAAPNGLGFFCCEGVCSGQDCPPPMP